MQECTARAARLAVATVSSQDFSELSNASLARVKSKTGGIQVNVNVAVLAAGKSHYLFKGTVTGKHT